MLVTQMKRGACNKSRFREKHQMKNLDLVYDLNQEYSVKVPRGAVYFQFLK